ncbi:HET-domain-containing protein, partial [Setomelanomma holmii]
MSSVPLPWEIDKPEANAQRVRVILDFQVDHDPSANKSATEQQGIIGRRVTSHIDNNLLNQWLSTCEQKHVGRCPHGSNAPSWDSNFSPAFVIDTHSWSITEAPPQCRYVALSYTWGTGPMLKHLRANSDLLRTPQSLRRAELPRTVRDAIVVVEGIGERYLWVDALCIVQDDALMQQSQIAKMDQVYAKSLFTIIAAHGNGAHAGIPGIGSTIREEAQEMLSIPGGTLRTMICNNTETGNTIGKAIWAQRAWTMQEGLCSGRLLIFTEHQVYWRC